MIAEEEQHVGHATRDIQLLYIGTEQEMKNSKFNSRDKVNKEIRSVQPA